jgi:hypothetical protein
MTLLIPIDRAAVSYQPNDLKSVRRAARPRFPLIAFLGELVDLRSTFRDAVRFKFISLGRKALFSWRHWGIKSNGEWSRQGSAAPPNAWLRWPASCENGRHPLAFRRSATRAIVTVGSTAIKARRHDHRGNGPQSRHHQSRQLSFHLQDGTTDAAGNSVHPSYLTGS